MPAAAAGPTMAPRRLPGSSLPLTRASASSPFLGQPQSSPRAPGRWAGTIPGRSAAASGPSCARAADLTALVCSAKRAAASGAAVPSRSAVALAAGALPLCACAAIPLLRGTSHLVSLRESFTNAIWWFWTNLTA